ncbi:MAG: ATP synthase F1 subunit epsilon [Oscillospiraceae bacterium]|jgi:F-type H+-transporting ATPase subunit epsilon|nr:ATP synthase F1 subunit epsilon [Oscillospiraceae bacterium]
MVGFNLKIVTPTRAAFDGVVKSVVLKTADGEICVLKGHEDYVAPIMIGPLRLEKESGEKKLGCAAYGFVNISNNSVNVFATTFEFVEEIDVARATKMMEKMKDIIVAGATGDELSDAQARYERCKARLKVIKLSNKN